MTQGSSPDPAIKSGYTVYLAWATSLLVSLLALIAWGNSYQWQLTGLSVYQVFPIFGLLAFSLMWSTYLVGALVRYGLSRDGLAGYYQAIGFIVLAAIMLHPGLLIWQLWHDGFGLPPESYLQHYVAPSMRLAALVGSTCLLIFLAYEFHHWFSDRRWWKIIGVLTDAAMVGIFYHSLRLGTQITGWFEIVWWFYGIILLVVLADKYLRILSGRLLTRHP